MLYTRTGNSPLLAFRATRQDITRIKELAALAGISTSELIRRLMSTLTDDSPILAAHPAPEPPKHHQPCKRCLLLGIKGCKDCKPRTSVPNKREKPKKLLRRRKRLKSYTTKA
jgi:hypothetical protein